MVLKVMLSFDKRNKPKLPEKLSRMFEQT